MLSTIQAKELKDQLEQGQDVIIVDVRAKEKFEAGHLSHPHANVQHIHKTEIFHREGTSMEDLDLPKETELIVTCTTGNSAAKCAALLADAGYQVKVLAGGLTAWHEQK
ncbi:rhodanese-like domain-containing protein [Cytobacillus spongiae]|jgi:rhodanese-related sulfurtransferase|uniref:rhodanese-like domain-containing protein n=1 Tax=Cytobacillus spongiae TaxID=2901381 RepID=UPI001F44B812|nr:rhodanese-like domain-containing protein [Cytobacillus spongiae]UII57659.1 rhodanese-like domain-containing protein [Cytobacillus spongiae]